MSNPNKKRKPKHHVKCNKKNTLKNLKRVSLEETSKYNYKEENGVESVIRIAWYTTEKFFKRDKKVIKESEWEVNDLNYPLLKGATRFRFGKYRRYYTDHTLEGFSSIWKKIKKERAKERLCLQQNKPKNK